MRVKCQSCCASCSKTGHIASRQTFHRDAGQTGWKTGRPGENGTGGNTKCGGTTFNPLHWPWALKLVAVAPPYGPTECQRLAGTDPVSLRSWSVQPARRRRLQSPTNEWRKPGRLGTGVVCWSPLSEPSYVAEYRRRQAKYTALQPALTWLTRAYLFTCVSKLPTPK